jgi:glucoamylase
MISTRLVLVLPLYALGFLQIAIAWPSVEPLAARASPDPLDSWLATETSTALQGVLDNIGSGGANTAGVSSGFVIASPSKSNPDCKYTSDRVEELSIMIDRTTAKTSAEYSIIIIARPSYVLT